MVKQVKEKIMLMSRGEKIQNVINWILLIGIGLICIFPVYYVLAVSLTSMESFNKFGFQLIPSQLSLDAYWQILDQDLIPRAYMNSILITVAGTIINMVLTILMAYPLANKRLPGRNIILSGVLFCLIFSGGLIPSFILVRTLGLTNTYWSVILPDAIWSWNVLILKNFFESVPTELLEVARIDGANEFVIMRDIVMPMSKPALATIGLFYAVAHWNDFFSPFMYLTNPRMQPLAVVLRSILRELTGLAGMPTNVDRARMAPNDGVRMAAVFLSIIPILLIYPWLQKYFTKGIMLGSIKG
ncbi:MAG: carbohydrate ABC transporter permease [Anaerolineaceae bacterium]